MFAFQICTYVLEILHFTILFFEGPLLHKKLCRTLSTAMF